MKGSSCIFDHVGEMINTNRKNNSLCKFFFTIINNRAVGYNDYGCKAMKCQFSHDIPTYLQDEIDEYEALNIESQQT